MSVFLHRDRVQGGCFYLHYTL